MASPLAAVPARPSGPEEEASSAWDALAKPVTKEAFVAWYVATHKKRGAEGADGVTPAKRQAVASPPPAAAAAAAAPIQRALPWAPPPAAAAAAAAAPAAAAAAKPAAARKPTASAHLKGLAKALHKATKAHGEACAACPALPSFPLGPSHSNPAHPGSQRGGTLGTWRLSVPVSVSSS